MMEVIITIVSVIVAVLAVAAIIVAATDDYIDMSYMWDGTLDPKDDE